MAEAVRKKKPLSEAVLKKFGRYFLLDRIAKGGMAEICRARLCGAEGLGRILVIKRIQSELRKNKEFLEMFRSEMKVTMGFSHPNIIQFFDYGEAESVPYIAMEFLDGKTLRQFASRSLKKKNSIAIEVALFVVEQAARGLHYAHTFKDKITGQPLDIVHRDISPQNILVSYEGQVKIVDFGIAKAVSNHQRTRSGIIKGKPSYMSPEQVAGERLDGRSDLFALGIVVWELLTGKKLFPVRSSDDYSVLKLIEHCDRYIKPPSKYNPQIPPELDTVVMRALAKDCNQRFKSTEAFADALQKVLFSLSPHFTSNTLSKWMHALFQTDIEVERKILQKINEQAEEILSVEMDHEPAKILSRNIGEIPKTKKEADVIQLPTFEKPPSLKSDDQVFVLRNNDIQNAVAIHASPLNQYANRVVDIGKAISERRMEYEKFYRPPAQRTSPYWFLTAACGAVLIFVGSQIARKDPKAIFEFIQWADTRLGSVVLRHEVEKVSSPTASSPDALNVKTAFLTLKEYPWVPGTQIRVRGTPVDLANLSIPVPLDQPVTLEAEAPGYKPYRKEFIFESATIAPGSEIRREVQIEPEHFGFLEVKTDVAAEVYARKLGTPPTNKQTFVLRTPVNLQALPTGDYIVQVVNPDLQMSQTVRAEITEGKVYRFEGALEAQKQTRSLASVIGRPDEILGAIATFAVESFKGFGENEVLENWVELGGGFSARQSVAAMRPILRTTGAQTWVHFESSGKGFDLPALQSMVVPLVGMSAFYVVRNQGDKETSVFSCQTDSGSDVFKMGFLDRKTLRLKDNVSNFDQVSPLAPGSAAIYSALFSRTAATLFQNGNLMIDGRNTGVDFSRTKTCSIGPLSGDLAELILYDHALLPGEQKAVEGLLSSKYGISILK